MTTITNERERKRRMPTPNAPTFWHIPYQRNPFFTGREDDLNQLYKTLRAKNAIALSHPQGISGLRGIGKTQSER
jgi:hypothetical protein